MGKRRVLLLLALAVTAGVATWVCMGLFGQAHLQDKISDCEAAGGAWLRDAYGYDCYQVEKLENYR